MERKGIRLRRIQWTKYIKMSLITLLRRIDSLISYHNSSKSSDINAVYAGMVFLFGNIRVEFHKELHKKLEEKYLDMSDFCKVQGGSNSMRNCKRCVEYMYAALTDMKAEIESLIEEQDLGKLKKKNDDLRTKVSDLKRGSGVYCSVIGNNCDRIFETKNQCFIIYDYKLKDFGDVVSNAVKTADLEPIISKHIKTGESGGMYCTTICKPIRSSKLCIADITKDNSNVGLEIGLAWRYGKPLILTMDKQERKEPPSDFTAFTRIEYTNSKELEENLKKEIKKCLT